MRFAATDSPIEVWKKIKNHVRPLTSEYVPIELAGNRVCAEDVLSPEDLPAFNRSTVDGYAVMSSDTFGASASAPSLLNLVGEVGMGGSAPLLSPGACVYVPTGGMLPEHADAVVMVEYTELLENLVNVLRPVSVGENVIWKGDDFKHDNVALERGKELRAQDLGALAALGIQAVKVYRRPKVEVLSTGNELVPYTEPSLPLGKVRDCNAPMIMEICRQKGAEITYGGILSDDPDRFREALQKAIETNDFVILSGGSSVGTRDFSAQALEELSGGRLLVEGVTIQPGKPLLFALCNRRPVLGLPGHPVSALSTFLLFGCRILDGLNGRSVPEYQPSVKAVLALNIPSKPGRTDVVRVKLRKVNEEWYATPIFGRSGILHTLTEADGFVVIPGWREGLGAGESVEVIIYGMNTYA